MRRELEIRGPTVGTQPSAPLPALSAPPMRPGKRCHARVVSACIDGGGGGEREREHRARGGRPARPTAKQTKPTTAPPPCSPPSSQAPNSPCNQFVNQIRQQAGAIAYSTCDKPVTVSTKPSPQCCELAAKFSPCKCDPDVHKTSGKDLSIATYRSTQVGCGGKCVEPNSVGC